MERPSCTSHLSKFCIKDWPEPKSMAFLETLAKYDIDTAVQLILCREKFIVKGMYKYLDYQEMLTVRRRELLYRRWALNVGEPLKQKIREKVSPPRSIIKRKQGDYDRYIQYSNKKGNAFIDHYDPEDYDPFYMRSKDPQYLKVTLPPFRDPLLQAQRHRAEENRTILQCETGKRYTMKEFKEVETKRLSALPPFSFARQDRRPNSGPAQRKDLPRISVRDKPGSARSCRPPGIRYFSVLKLRLEEVQDKVLDPALGISGLMLPAWRMADQHEVGSSRASSKAAEAWSHRPASLRSTNRPARCCTACTRRSQHTRPALARPCTHHEELDVGALSTVLRGPPNVG
ncbi:protein FAM228B-like [Petaurus breviceps papuanus]|uniref:protein FAM228B-like n=1 Tax=Petaurus breviceps papuanus TaxID=3040969 RepID=UPI0036DA193B